MPKFTHGHGEHNHLRDNAWLRREMDARGFRLMAVYEHLRQAVDWMFAEMEAQQRLLEACGDSVEGRLILADAKRMTSAIAFERDRAAEVVCAVFGETPFKTGKVHAAFYEALNQVMASRGR